MAKRISQLNTIATASITADGSVPFEVGSPAHAYRITMAQARTQLFAGGSGYTATDYLSLGASAPTTGLVRVDGGTVTTLAPILSGIQTWNAIGTTFTGLLVNITDTASASSSLLADFQVGGVSKCSISKTGALTTVGAITASFDSATININALTGDPGLYFKSAGTTRAIVQSSAADTIRFLDHSLGVMGTLSGTTLTVNSFVGALTGNASTATKLATARNINGVAFDGTADITITAAVGAATTGALGGVKIDYTEATPIAQLASTARRLTLDADGSAVLNVDTTMGTFTSVPVGTYIARSRMILQSGVGFVLGATIKLTASTPANISNPVSTALSPSTTVSGAVNASNGNMTMTSVGHVDSSGSLGAVAVVEWYFKVTTAAVDIVWSYASSSSTPGETQKALKGSFIELIRTA